ncbi:MAG: sulfite reductase subunit alpha [Opitutaceae bacterium]|nr:sulfite reductase subunit alpha [Opitutaceae bacterium]
MSASVPVLPDSAPFSPEQRAWLNGFLAGVFSRASVPSPTPNFQLPTTSAPSPLLITFGSQTGTCEGLAKKAAKEAKKHGFAPTVRDLAEVTLSTLAQTPAALVITSTYGEGEPPDNAKTLHAALASAEAPRLEQLHFSVLAVGDRNYVKFCQCGKDFDARLAALGAKRATPLAECELGHAATFTKWLDTALAALAAATSTAQPIPTNSELGTLNPEPEGDAEPAFHRENPFPAPLLAVRRLSGEGSAKEVNHIEFSLEGSGLTYAAGDALGVVPQNDPALVSEVLAVLGHSGDEPVATAAGDRPLKAALLEHLDLGKPSAELLATLKVDPAAAPHHVLDALHAAPNGMPAAADFAAALRPLQARLYSISSSPKAHPGQVHLTVGAVRYDLNGRARKGVASTFLPERGLTEGKVGVYVHTNKGFRPPADAATPMIMVGPGTGIAPFRAFLSERRSTGATGRNWLFFGDQKESTDFLYRDELLALHADGFLTRLDLAWSRDQSAKVYVQNRMLEHATELWGWLEAGAHFYVCGDANRMAKDVHAALLRVIETAGGKSPEAAAEYVAAMQAAKRYQRDVY